jgi:antitoxin component of RelBE/YafQ-DinJ toxin-antitoxin module
MPRKPKTPESSPPVIPAPSPESAAKRPFRLTLLSQDQLESIVFQVASNVSLPFEKRFASLSDDELSAMIADLQREKSARSYQGTNSKQRRTLVERNLTTLERSLKAQGTINEALWMNADWVFAYYLANIDEAIDDIAVTAHWFESPPPHVGAAPE